MPDTRKIGIHELRSAIHHFQEAELRLVSAATHLEASGAEEDDAALREAVEVVRAKLLPNCLEFLGTLTENEGLRN